MQSTKVQRAEREGRRTRRDRPALGVALLLAALVAGSCGRQNAGTRPGGESGEPGKAEAPAEKQSSACAAGKSESEAPAMRVPPSFAHEVVTIECDDGYRVTGDYLRHRRFRQAPLPAAVFLHEEGRDRRIFHPLTLMCASAGLSVLVLDLRGHGENPSLKGNDPRAAGKLTPEDYGMMVSDMRNVISFLAAKSEVNGGRMGLVGSDIGANLAIMTAAQPWAAAIRCVIAVSPGLDYHGLKPEAAARALPRTTRVYLVAAKDDEYSFSSATALHRLFNKTEEFVRYDQGGHGTKLYGQGLLHSVAQWLQDSLVAKPGS